MEEEQPPPLLPPAVQEVLPERITGPICCPYQTLEEHIPEIELDIKNDGRCHFRFLDVQDRRLARVTNTAPLLYRGKPLTARRNKSNPPPWNEVEKEQTEDAKGGVSYHMIRLVNTLAVQDRGKKVKLLIDDNSQYCLGFQRCTVVGQAEVWSPWYRVQGNFAWPSFLPSEELPIHGDHRINVEIGGHSTLDDILRGLWRYPDFPRDVDSLQRTFLRGVVVLCETIRLLSVSNDVVDRIRRNAVATPLRHRTYKRIRSWNSACKFVLLTVGKHHGKVNVIRLRKFHEDFGYESFEDIVNELRILKWQDFLLEHYKGDDTRWLKRKQPGTEVANPRFDPPRQQ